jgi:hypothetical protein
MIVFLNRLQYCSNISQHTRTLPTRNVQVGDCTLHKNQLKNMFANLLLFILIYWNKLFSSLIKVDAVIFYSWQIYFLKC